MTYQLHVSAVS